MQQYLTFELDKNRYGVAVKYVNSVLDIQDITPLPQSNTLITGLTNVRGNVVPVFNPRKTLLKTKVDNISMPEYKEHKTKSQASSKSEKAEEEEEGGIIIFEIENGSLLPFIGLETDKIGKVVNLEDKDILAVPAFLPEEAARYYSGFCFINETRHSILNIKELSSKETLFAIQEGGHLA